MNARLFLVTCLVVAVGISCAESGSRSGEVEVSAAVVSEGEDIAAGYLVITATEGDTLLGARSSVTETVSLHETTDGAMLPVESLEVPAGAELRLEPGGDHLMLEGLTEALEPGDTVDLVLELSEAGELSATAEVVAYVDILEAVDGEL